MEYIYLVVEGPHDIECVGRLLKPHGFQRIKELSRLRELAPLFLRLVPRKFPADDEDLLKRVPVPMFFAGSERVLAVHSAVGDTRLVGSVEETMASLEGGLSALQGVGLLLDADSETSAVQRFKELRDKLGALRLTIPESPGAVAVAGSLRVGIYVLPDNATSGTLEDLLLEAATKQYPALLTGARGYVDAVDPTLHLPSAEDRKDFKKPAGKSKALVACVANVLRPGKAVQVSIQDNSWLTGEALKLPRIVSLQRFLEGLVGVSASEQPAGNGL